MVQFAMQSREVTMQMILPKGDSCAIQFAAIIRDVLSHSHRRYMFLKGDSNVVQLHMHTRQVAGCKGVRAGNQKPDIKFVCPKKPATKKPATKYEYIQSIATHYLGEGCVGIKAKYIVHWGVFLISKMAHVGLLRGCKAQWEGLK